MFQGAFAAEKIHEHDRNERRGTPHRGYTLTFAWGKLSLQSATWRSFRGSQVRLGKCSREFLCDLLKPAGLKDDLRLGVADDIASKLLAFYDKACIADAGRDLLICHVASDERTTFALCDQIFQFDPTNILNEIASFHPI